MPIKGKIGPPSWGARKSLGLQDIVEVRGGTDWNTFIKKQNVHLGDPEDKADHLQVKQANHLRRMYLFPPTWAESWPGVWAPDEIAAAQEMRRGGATMDAIASIGPVPATSSAAPAPSAERSEQGQGQPRTTRGGDVAPELQQRVRYEPGSSRDRDGRTPQPGVSTEATRDMSRSFGRTPYARQAMTCSGTDAIKGRSLERLELLRSQSVPEIVRKREPRRSDGRPPVELFYNFSSMHKRPVPGNFGTFGSAGYAGTTGLGGRTVLPKMRQTVR